MTGWGRYLASLGCAMAVVAMGLSLFLADQNCHLFEGSHKRDVDRLRQTYDYLARLDERALGEGLNVALLRNLPNVEREARTDAAPEYCDTLFFGRPEPDPEIPKRPRSLR